MQPLAPATDAWPSIEEAVERARRSAQVRSEIALDDVPAPVRLAKHGLALSGEILDSEDIELAHGRFVLLHEPGGQATWQGDTRAVVFVRAVLEADLAIDPLLLEVGWDWLSESVAERGLELVALSGTVSRTGSQAFGDIASREPEGAIEIRASWTVRPTGADSSLLAWCDLMATAAGLIPLNEGVRTLRSRS
jgi:hypothetical protein